MFKNRLNQAIDNLTPSEETIADYMSSHLDEITNMTSTELARQTGTAQATVIRFSKKLGYSSYRRMIHDIGTYDADEHIHDDIDYTESMETTRLKLKNEYDNVFNLTCELNKNSKIQKTVDAIYMADNVVLFGITSRKGDISHYFTNLFLKIGINAFTDEYPSAIYAKLEICKKNDVIILLSESGETREIINFAKIAHKKDMIVISITRHIRNTLSRQSDINLQVIEYGERTFLRNCMMVYSYEVLMNMIYLNLLKKNPARAEKLSSRNYIVTKTQYFEK